MSAASSTRNEAPVQTGRPRGREILRQQETQEHAERREAIRALLMRPLLTPTSAEAREALRLVRRHSAWTRRCSRGIRRGDGDAVVPAAKHAVFGDDFCFRVRVERFKSDEIEAVVGLDLGDAIVAGGPRRDGFA